MRLGLEKLKCLKDNLPYSHAFHLRFNVNCPGIDPGPLQCETSDNRWSHDTDKPSLACPLLGLNDCVLSCYVSIIFCCFIIISSLVTLHSWVCRYSPANG
jgi:hypothetical protein